MPVTHTKPWQSFGIRRCLAAWRSLILLLPVLTAAGNTLLYAQPVTSHRSSLQWLTTQADLIVQGAVEHVTPLNPDNPFARFYEVSIKSRAAVKGQAPTQFCFVTNQRDGYQKLQDEKHEGLFFLTSSRREFNRKMLGYFHTRCPWICQKVYDIDAKSLPAVSFNRTGIREITDGPTVLAIVTEYAQSLPDTVRTLDYSLREPDHRAFTGYDSFLHVPLDQTLYAIALDWSEKSGVRARVANELLNGFTPTIDYEAAKSHHDGLQQVATEWQHASTLSVDSLEWMATDCDVVVQGTIADAILVQKGDSRDRTGFDPTLDRHLVKLNVTDFIKGHAAEKTVSFVIENGGRISKWQTEQARIVVFLRDRTLSIRNENAAPLIAACDDDRCISLRYVGRGPDVKTLIALDAENHPPQFSANLTWTNDPQEMLRIVQRYLARVPAALNPPLNTRSMHVRGVESLLKSTPWARGKEHVGITFPINDYLEDHAQRWVGSADKLHRWLGAYALAFFRSAQNAEVLRGLLSDPAKWEPPVHVSSYTHRRVAHLVRWEAWMIVTAWGYDVAAPEFGEPR